jgi:hypothetical protein
MLITFGQIILVNKKAFLKKKKRYEKKREKGKR